MVSFVYAVRCAEKKTLAVGEPVEMTTLSKGAFLDVFLDAPKGIVRKAADDYQSVLSDLQGILNDARKIIESFDGKDRGGNDLGLNLSPLQNSIEKVQSSIEGVI